MSSYTDDLTFTITCTMRPRWAAQFIGMLTAMQDMGNQGSSRRVSFYADGDGDFRPKFEWNSALVPAPAEPATFSSGNLLFFDAG